MEDLNSESNDVESTINSNKSLRFRNLSSVLLSGKMLVGDGGISVFLLMYVFSCCSYESSTGIFYFAQPFSCSCLFHDIWFVDIIRLLWHIGYTI